MPGLQLAYVDEGGAIVLRSSFDGVTWTSPRSMVGASSPLAPALANLSGKLFAVFVDNTGTGNLMISSSADSVAWSAPKPLSTSARHVFTAASCPSVTTDAQPALGALTIAYQSSVALAYGPPPARVPWNVGTATTDPQGNNANGPHALQEGATAQAVAIAGLAPAHSLCAAFVADDGTNQLVVNIGGTNHVVDQESLLGPALAEYNNQLWLLYVAADGTGQLMLTSSPDGIAWTPPIRVPGAQSALSPSMVLRQPAEPPDSVGELWFAYVESGTSEVYVGAYIPPYGTTGGMWSASVLVAGTTTARAPALAIFGVD